MITFISVALEKRRPAPRLPEFLDDSLRRDGLFDDYLRENEARSCDYRYNHDETSPPRLKDRDFSRSPAAFSFSLPPEKIKTCSPINKRTVSSFEAESRFSQVQSANFDHDFDKPLPSNPSGALLLPPSAFAVTPASPTISNCSRDLIDFGSSSDSPATDCSSSAQGKDTFKTFVASPNHNREELKLIYRKLQEFQKLRDQLK